MENFSMEGAAAALVGLVAIGVFAAKFTKTDKDDVFWSRVGAMLKSFMPGSKKDD